MMAEANRTPAAGPPGNPPVHLWIRADLQLGIRILRDHEAGRIKIVPAIGEPLAWAELMPEAGLEAAVQLIGAVHRLFRPRAE
jgi:hypothetical protein